MSAGFYSIKNDRFYNPLAVKNTLMFKDIYSVKADVDNSIIFDATPDKIILCCRIGDLQTEMNQPYIIRPQKSHLVSLYYVAHLEKPKDNYTGKWVRLINGSYVLCAKAYVDLFNQILINFRNNVPYDEIVKMMEEVKLYYSGKSRFNKSGYAS